MTNMTMVNFVYLWILLIWIRCTTGDTLFSCDFGNSTEETSRFCGMVQDMGDDFDWKLTRTSGKPDTGPVHDHTGNAGGTGMFLWTDSDDGAPGAMATISTPPFNLTDGEGLLALWYNIYGDGRLQITVCENGSPVHILDGDPKNLNNQWLELNLTVSCEDKQAQITFTSTLISDVSDIGIDDLHLYDNTLTTSDTTYGPVVTSTFESSSYELTTSGPYTRTSPDGFTTTSTVEASEPPTSLSPLPTTGIALPVTLGVVAVFFVIALIILICFIMKRRIQPEKPISQGTVHRFDNHAYSTELDDVRGNTTDTRRNTNSTFDSSTWRSEVSTTSGTGTNDTLGGSQSPNRKSQASSGGSGSGAPGETGDTDTRHYFVLNPERASMLVKDTGGGGDDAQNRYDPVALYDNKPERYTYIENDGSSNTKATGDAVAEGTDVNGYDPVTIKDDITGGYQVVEDTGSTAVGGGMQNPYEPIIVGENPSKSIKTKASERKAPTPAARKNVPPKPKGRNMVDNVLYKPMNGEQMVDNVLYNPIHDDK